MILSVSVRELKVVLCVGDGSQSFKWLATRAAQLYAQQHHQCLAAQFTPVLVSNDQGYPLFPAQLINERLADGDSVSVELVGPKLNISDSPYARIHTLWELFAYTSRFDQTLVQLSFDASSVSQPVSVCSVVGNFCGWQLPGVSLHPDSSSGLWTCSLEVPVGAELVFKFLVNNDFVVSGAHHVTSDKSGTPFNVLKVPLTAHHAGYEHLRDRSLAAILPVSAADSSPFAIHDTIPRMLQPLNDSRRRQHFENDMRNMRLETFLTSPGDRVKLKEVLAKNLGQLDSVFACFSTRGASDIATMNFLQYASFSRACNLQNKGLTGPSLDHIFQLLNDHLGPLDAEVPLERAITVRNPLDPSNRLVRAQFYEALVRFAVAKFPGNSLDRALEQLFTEFVLPPAGQIVPDSLFERMLQPEAQLVFFQYGSRLFDVFHRHAQATEIAESRFPMLSLGSSELERLITVLDLEELFPRSEALTAFAAARVDEKENRLDITTRIGYSDFLAACARLAQAHAKSEAGSFAEHLRTFFCWIFPTKEQASERRLLADAKAVRLAELEAVRKKEEARKRAIEEKRKKKKEAELRKKAEEEAELLANRRGRRR